MKCFAGQVKPDATHPVFVCGEIMVQAKVQPKEISVFAPDHGAFDGFVPSVQKTDPPIFFHR